MPEQNPSFNWSERNAILDHLDRRRIGVEQAMWQAPALTVAAQAFLLRVLTDRSAVPQPAARFGHCRGNGGAATTSCALRSRTARCPLPSHRAPRQHADEC